MVSFFLSLINDFSFDNEKKLTDLYTKNVVFSIYFSLYKYLNNFEHFIFHFYRKNFHSFLISFFKIWVIKYNFFFLNLNHFFQLSNVIEIKLIIQATGLYFNILQIEKTESFRDFFFYFYQNKFLNTKLKFKN